MTDEPDESRRSDGPPGDGAVDSGLLDAAQAIADGETLIRPHDPTDPVLAELHVIAQLARLHRQVGASDLAAADPSESLGDLLARTRHDATSRPDLSRAERWGPLFVLEEVGHGAFGDVYRAWDPALDREVALKRIRLPASAAAKASTVVREGQLLASVNHPNVINVHGAAAIDDEVGIWMEFVRGRTLERIVADDGPMSADEAAVVAQSLCGALSAVHQQGLLHRDIKAANVMRASGGRIVLLDFGTTTELDTGAPGTRRIAGTPLYMAPEVMSGSPATPQSDIYSLGILCFFLVTGTYPVYAKSLAELRDIHSKARRLLLSDVRMDLPAWFVSLVEKASAPAVTDRFVSVGAMQRELASGHARRPSQDHGVRPWTRVAGIAATILGLLTLLGFVTSTYFAYRLGQPDLLSESPLLWPYWGLRSVVAPLGLAALATIAWVTLSAMCTGLLRIAPMQPVRDRVAAASSRVRELLVRTPQQSVGELLLVVQVAALGLSLWWFRDLLNALDSFVGQSAVADMIPLRPSNRAEHQLYRQVLSGELIVFALAWRWAIRFARVREASVWTASTIAGLGALALTGFLLTIPFRILYHNFAEEVTYAGGVCYLVGTVDTRVQLFCPTQDTPRTKSVSIGDPLLVRGGFDRNIFTPLDTWRGPR